MRLSPFHIAIPVADLDAARRFYCDLLGCEEGRSDREWIDFNFFGHQLVCHLVSDNGSAGNVPRGHNPVDGHDVPVPHYGVVMPMDEWEVLADRLVAAETPFIIAPYIRFRGKPGEQGTLFIADPSGNPLEFKGFRDPGQLFAV